MFLCVNLKDFEKQKLLINNKIRNNIINNSYFYRLYYSDEEFISNGVVIVFNLQDIKFEKYFNKNKINFNEKKNSFIVKKLNELENDILSSLVDVEKKEKKFLLKEQLDNNYIKIIDENNIQKKQNVCNIIIKISGIWESKSEYGLTFRCIKAEKKMN
tara:strand:+ start:1016 stop:1489 length:474 start_codon:yes stop_codon:yes gene_type:complete